MLSLFLVPALMAILATPAFAAQTVFDFFGHSGSGPGQFARSANEAPADYLYAGGVSGLAVNDTSGDVYAVDRRNNRIEQFDSDGGFIRGWGVDTIPGGATGTGTLTAESNEVTSVVTTSKAFIPGQEVTGTGIPAGTRIETVTTGVGVLSKMTLSGKATVSGAGVTITAVASGANVPQNERQTVSVKAAANSFKLKFTTTMPTAEATTGNIAFNASAATVQSALEGLANVGAGNVEVTGPVGGPYVVEFKGKFADTNVAQMTKVAGSPDLSGPPGPTALIATQQEGAGSFEKCTVATSCQAGAATGLGQGGMNQPVGVAINQANQNVYVTDSGNLRVNQYDAGGSFVRSWGANVVSAGPGNRPEVQSIKVAASSGTFVLTLGGANNTTATGTGTYASGSNEITSVTTSAGAFLVGKQIAGAGIPLGTKITAVEPGKLTISNNTTEAKSGTALTADLPFDASAATVEAALNALNTIGGALGSVSVSGGPGNPSGSDPYQVTFGGALANSDTAQIAINASGLGAAEGTQLSCTATPATATLSYEWLRNGVPIGGASAPTYTIVAADAGASIQCRAKASSGDGATLKATAPPVIASPVSAVAPPGPGTPTISGALAAVGSTFTCAPGTWTPSPAPTFSYQWLRNGVPIPGATSTTYVTQAADSETAIQCEVTGTNAAGAAVGQSALKLVRAEQPLNTGVPGTAPTISGTGSVGNVLTCANGTWTGATTFSYQWLRSGVSIPGATANTYTTVAADEGAAIQCQVTATNASGAAGAISANTLIAPIPNPTPPVRPSAAISVTGNRNVGQTLTCNSGTWTPASPTASFSYQWLRNGAPIGGATASTYVQVVADLDKLVQCQVTATSSVGASNAISPSALAALTVNAPPSAASSLTQPTVASTIQNGGGAEVCNAGVDTCASGVNGSVGGAFGSFGSQDLVDPRLAVAPGGPYVGDVFVADQGNKRIQVFDPGTGAFVAAFGADVLLSGTETFGKRLCLAALGNVCRAGSNTGLTSPNTYGFGGSNQDGQPKGLAIDSTGAVYVTGSQHTYLQKYSPNLATEQDFAPWLCSKSNGPVLGCSEVTVDPSTDDVYVVFGVPGEKEECFGSICFSISFIKERILARLDSMGSQPASEETLQDLGIQQIPGMAVDGSTGNLRSGRLYVSTNTPEQRIDVLGEPAPPSFEFEPIQPADVGAREVNVHGFVNPNGNKINTTYRFETLRQGGAWTPYPVPDVDLGNGTSPVAIDEAVAGLRPNTAYKIRLSVIKGGVNRSPVQTFTTLPAGPDVETGPARWSGPPATGPSLTFTGTVDDNNQAAHYYFEYGTDASYGKRVPLFESASLPPSQEPFLARQTINGLDPAGTYHYRLIARTVSGTNFGADGEVGPAATAGRFPEMVSPVEKGVGQVGHAVPVLQQADQQAAFSGDRMAYKFEYGEPGTDVGGEILALGARGAGGWNSEQLISGSSALSLVPEAGTAHGVTHASQGDVKWLSPELDCSFFQSPGKVNAEVPQADFEAGIWHLFRRDVSGNVKMISPPNPLNGNNRGINFKVRGASSDCNRVIFATGYKLLPGLPIEEKTHLYEWENSGGADGTLRLVDILPDGSIPLGSIRDEPDPQFDTIQGGIVEMNAVSRPDASRTFFFATSTQGGDTGKKAVFLRKNHAVTIDVSQSQSAVPNNQDSEYQMASVDGSHVFFTAIAGLAQNSTTTVGNSLYDYNVNTGVLSDLTRNTDAANTAGAKVAGVYGASDDGSYVYFAAEGQLIPGQGKTYAESAPATGFYNVYVSHNGALSYVATTLKKDSFLSWPFVAGLSVNPPLLWRSRVTPNGKFLLFSTTRDLTPYVANSARQFFRYSFDSKSIACVTCRPDGALPTLPNPELIKAVNIPYATNDGADAYQQRAISADGSRIFFNSAEALVPGALEGELNAYEWHDGTINLLTRDGKVIDISADGSNVFVLTAEPLVAQDQDTAPDMYDLRIGGGFPYVATEVCDPLSDGSCQGTPPTPPTPGADPASGNFNGPGNPPPATTKPKCKKGQVLKHGKCVKKPKKTKVKKGKAGKRAAKHNRGGSK